jgi:hypothetical protein
MQVINSIMAGPMQKSEIDGPAVVKMPLSSQQPEDCRDHNGAGAAHQHHSQGRKGHGCAAKFKGPHHAEGV